MSLGTGSCVGGTDSRGSAAAVGNQPRATGSREGQGEAHEQHAGRFPRQGKAGCLSPLKPEPQVCLPGGRPCPSTAHPQQHKAFSFVTHRIPSPGQGNGAALCTRCRCQARPVAVAYGA